MQSAIKFITWMHPPDWKQYCDNECHDLQAPTITMSFLLFNNASCHWRGVYFMKTQWFKNKCKMHICSTCKTYICLTSVLVTTHPSQKREHIPCTLHKKGHSSKKRRKKRTYKKSQFYYVNSFSTLLCYEFFKLWNSVWDVL